MFGLELHPAIVHYPIALSVIGALALLAYAVVRRPWLRWVGPLLLTIALAGAGAAYFSGESAHDRAADLGVPHDEITRHESTAINSIGVVALATLLAWATVAGRRGIWIAVPIAIAAAGMILWTAHLGGRLVFIHGAGRVTDAGAPAPGLPAGAASPEDSTGAAPDSTKGVARQAGHKHGTHVHTGGGHDHGP